MQHANPRLSALATAHHRFFLHNLPSTARIIDGDYHDEYSPHLVDLIKSSVKRQRGRTAHDPPFTCYGSCYRRLCKPFRIPHYDRNSRPTIFPRIIPHLLPLPIQQPLKKLNPPKPPSSKPAAVLAGLPKILCQFRHRQGAAR